jgi:hypothetical protein
MEAAPAPSTFQPETAEETRMAVQFRTAGCLTSIILSIILTVVLNLLLRGCTGGGPS